MQDSDILVKLKAFEAAATLTTSCYLEVETLTEEVWPSFVYVINQSFDEDQSLHFFSKMLGPFLHNVS